MKTPTKTESQPLQSGEQDSVDRFLQLVGKKPESPQLEQPDPAEEGVPDGAFDQQNPSQRGVVDTLRNILHGEYTVDKLLGVLHGLVPIVDHIKQSIEASSSTIPSASTQLSSVTQATESATVTILDNLEALAASLTGSEENLAKAAEQNQRNTAIDEEFGRALSAFTVARKDDKELAELYALWSKRDSVSKILSHLDSIRQCLAGAKDTSMQIAMALQVQDITSQQIAGVLHLIEEVRLRLVRTLYQVERQTEQLQDQVQSTEKPIAGSFDMNASYSISADRQSSADEVIQQWTAQQAKR